MSIKRILVPIPGFVEDFSEIDMAVSAAKPLEAHVEAMFVSAPSPGPRSIAASDLTYGVQRS